MGNSIINAIIEAGNLLAQAIVNAGNSISEAINSMDGSVFTAQLGVAGTLLGTILGWLLNHFSQKGKLNVYVRLWQDSFQHNHKGIMSTCTSAAQAAYYSCDLSLDVYNSSAETRIMRNIQIVFAKGKTEIMVRTPDDRKTERFGAGCTKCDTVGPINIPPKSIVTVDLHYGEWDENKSIENYWKVNKIFLRYTDEKNKVKKIPISSKNYADYFPKSEEVCANEKK